jgi:hypothetical protein
LEKILADRRWNKTSLALRKGATYRFSSSMEWTDWTRHPTATGYSDWKIGWLFWLRRMPRARWFSLIGAIDKRRDLRLDIGRLIENGEPYTAPASGTLYCYANDVWFMYWNNRGYVTLEMREVEGPG